MEVSRERGVVQVVSLFRIGRHVPQNYGGLVNPEMIKVGYVVHNCEEIRILFLYHVREKCFVFAKTSSLKFSAYPFTTTTLRSYGELSLGNVLIFSKPVLVRIGEVEFRKFGIGPVLRNDERTRLWSWVESEENVSQFLDEKVVAVCHTYEGKDENEMKTSKY